MPDGEMRRPPQLWEQRLSRLTSVLGVGLSSSATTSIVQPVPPPGGGGGVEPAPVGPPPGTFTKPSTPQLVGAVQGINVLWDGLNSAGDLYPYDTSFIEVHSSTAGTGFTLGTATLRGRLSRPGGLYVGGLAAGTTFHFRFRGADPAGNFTEASDAASGQTGLTTVSDYGVGSIGTGAVSFDARAIGGITTTVGTATPSGPREGDVWLDTSGGNTTHKRYTGGVFVTQAWASASIGANVITATQMAAGAITAGAIAAGAITAGKIEAGAVTTDKLTAGTITGFVISGGTITGGFITGGTVQGSLIKSASSGQRVEIQSSQVSLIDSGGTSRGVIYGDTGGMLVGAGDNLYASAGTVYLGPFVGPFVTVTNGSAVAVGSLSASGNVSSATLTVSGANVDMIGVFNNNTTGIDEVGIVATTGRLRRISSSQAIKYDVTPITGTLSTSVDVDRVSDVVTVDPLAVLDVAVTEFSVIDGGEPTDRRVLGFIAEDVADKLPVAVTRDADGQPLGVLDTSLVAALLAVAQQQQATIEDLRTRIEILEV